MIITVFIASTNSASTSHVFALELPASIATVADLTQDLNERGFDLKNRIISIFGDKVSNHSLLNEDDIVAYCAPLSQTPNQLRLQRMAKPNKK